jgi:hypothetical protein
MLTGSGDGAALAGRVEAGRLRAPRLHGSTCGAPADMYRGLRRLENHQRRGIEVAEQTHRRRSSVKSRCYTGRGHGWRAWGASWR